MCHNTLLQISGRWLGHIYSNKQRRDDNGSKIAERPRPRFALHCRGDAERTFARDVLIKTENRAYVRRARARRSRPLFTYYGYCLSFCCCLSVRSSRMYYDGTRDTRKNGMRPRRETNERRRMVENHTPRVWGSVDERTILSTNSRVVRRRNGI